MNIHLPAILGLAVPGLTHDPRHMTGARVADHANGAAGTATLDAQGTAVHVVPGDVVLFWGLVQGGTPKKLSWGSHNSNNYGL